jgi:hypothetical protein
MPFLRSFPLYLARNTDETVKRKKGRYENKEGQMKAEPSERIHAKKTA